MPAPVRFALAGFGAWGKHPAQSIAENPGANLVALTAPPAGLCLPAEESIRQGRLLPAVDPLRA